MSASSGRTVLIVGAGLLGASAGLALGKAGWQVYLSDVDARAERLAVDLGAGQAGPAGSVPDVVLVAVPPRACTAVIEEVSRMYSNATVSDVGSVKSQVQVEVERLGVADRFVGGHPMAGRERSGPSAARDDLFEGRPWVLCPSDATSQERIELITELVRDCGGQPISMSPRIHDDAVARVSHSPQLLASMLAAQLLAAPAGEIELAGQGLRDTVRVAGSDPALWVDILSSNAGAVAVVLSGVAADLQGVIAELQSVERQTAKSTNSPLPLLTGVLQRGREGYERIPGKHGAPATTYAVVPVVIPDEPGALARLLAAAGEAGINVEDIAIEHSPGQPVGLVELSVAPESVTDLSSALAGMGWAVH
ncbi:MAG TPA: prephenate dehydrogenase [Actinomycetes bacterium]|nr:prephenate dehydrogenase [Actinomycetes bacterium]